MTLIEPGAIDTDLWRGALDTTDEVEAGMKPEHRRRYGRQIAGMRKVVERIPHQAAPVEKVADAIARLTTRA